MKSSEPPQAHESDGRVGPVLLASAISDIFIAAMSRDNRDVEVINRGSYVRVEAIGRCVLKKQSVEEEMGAACHLPSELEKVMCSFRGKMTLTEDEIVWVEGKVHE